MSSQPFVIERSGAPGQGGGGRFLGKGKADPSDPSAWVDDPAQARTFATEPEARQFVDANHLGPQARVAPSSTLGTPGSGAPGTGFSGQPEEEPGPGGAQGQGHGPRR